MKTMISLFDHTNKIYVRFRKCSNGIGWQRWVSKSKRKWTLMETFNTMEEALRHKEEIVNNNYRNLYNLIVKK